MKCLTCEEETGSSRKKYCGSYAEMSSCASKRAASIKQGHITALHSKKNGEAGVKKRRDKQLTEENYCLEARSSGYF